MFLHDPWRRSSQQSNLSNALSRFNPTQGHFLLLRFIHTLRPLFVWSALLTAFA